VRTLALQSLGILLEAALEALLAQNLGANFLLHDLAKLRLRHAAGTVALVGIAAAEDAHDLMSVLTP
jgi:hypothetical protein